MGRAPVIHVRCAFSGAPTSIPVRVDYRMTVEMLREAVMARYAAHCRDEGVRFLPPSANLADYDVLLCDGSSAAAAPASAADSIPLVLTDLPLAVANAFTSLYPHVLIRSQPSGGAPVVAPPNEQPVPLVPSRLGGESVRDQLALLSLPPQHALVATMTIGRPWLARQAIIDAETAERDVIVDKHAKLLTSLAFFENVSFERAAEQQQFRERRDATAVSRFEDAMLYAFVAWQQHCDQLEREKKLLRRLYDIFDREAVPAAIAAEASLQRAKRVAVAAAAAAVGVAFKADRAFELGE